MDGQIQYIKKKPKVSIFSQVNLNTFDIYVLFALELIQLSIKICPWKPNGCF